MLARRLYALYVRAHIEVCRLSLPAQRSARARARALATNERASERARAVITFYFKDGRGSFAILCRTSICLIYRNYTYTDPVRFCHNLYPEYRRTRPAVASCVRVYRVSWRSGLSRSGKLLVGLRKMMTVVTMFRASAQVCETIRNRSSRATSGTRILRAKF